MYSAFTIRAFSASEKVSEKQAERSDQEADDKPDMRASSSIIGKQRGTDSKQDADDERKFHRGLFIDDDGSICNKNNGMRLKGDSQDKETGLQYSDGFSGFMA